MTRKIAAAWIMASLTLAAPHAVVATIAFTIFWFLGRMS